MSALQRKGGALQMEGVPLEEIARRFGTPCYVYSRSMVEAAYREFADGLAGVDHLICYAVKANSNLAILDVLRRLGSGFDIVSGGELSRVRAAGGESSKILFSGVGKSHAEIRYALAERIRCFNVESEPELERLNALAGAAGVKAAISLRVNPDVDAKTHPYISTGLAGNKFGIPYGRALEVYRRAARLPHLEVTGIDCHIGSQIVEAAPLEEAVDRVMELADAVIGAGIPLHHVDFGGGFGIRYREGESTMDVGAYTRKLAARLQGRGLQVLLEPGRYIVGNAGVLLTRIEYLKVDKAKRFAVVDASMSELIRPALYEAWHDIVPVSEVPARASATYDVVGPVCESADVLGTDRSLAVAEGDLLAILSTGAYAMAMASNYNTRPRPPEVLVDGALAVEIRARETLESLYAGERTLDRAK
jgi:diaminopimelate decarboxylase